MGAFEAVSVRIWLRQLDKEWARANVPDELVNFRAERCRSAGMVARAGVALTAVVFAGRKNDAITVASVRPLCPNYAWSDDHVY